MTPESLTPFAIEFWVDAGVAVLCGTIFGVLARWRRTPTELMLFI